MIKFARLGWRRRLLNAFRSPTFLRAFQGHKRFSMLAFLASSFLLRATRHPAESRANVVLHLFLCDHAPFRNLFSESSRFIKWLDSSSGNLERVLHVREAYRGLAHDGTFDREFGAGATNSDLATFGLVVTIYRQGNAEIEASLVLVKDFLFNSAAEVMVLADGLGRGMPLSFVELRDKLKDPGRLKLLESDGNVGPYRLRNIALVRLETEFIGFHDPGDLDAGTRRVREQVGALEKNRFLKYVEVHGMRFGVCGAPEPVNSSLALTWPTPVTSVFRRDALVSVGGFLPLRTRGDREMTKRMGFAFGPGAGLSLGYLGLLASPRNNSETADSHDLQVIYGSAHSWYRSREFLEYTRGPIPAKRVAQDSLPSQIVESRLASLDLCNVAEL